jgi:hypothetical protein
MCVCVLGATLTKDVFLLTFVFLNPPAKWAFFSQNGFLRDSYCDDRWVTMAQGDEFFFFMFL